MQYTVETCPKKNATSNRCVNGKYKCGGCGGIWKTCPTCKGRRATSPAQPQHKAITQPEYNKTGQQVVKVVINGKTTEQVISKPGRV